MEDVTIIIKGIPQLGIDDNKPLLCRIVETGLHYEEKVMTEGKHRLSYDENRTLQRLIQSRVFDKYSLETYAQESFQLDLIEASDDIQLQFIQNGELETWDINILSITSEKVTGTKSNKYTIAFTKKDIDTESINNYLESSYIKSLFDSNKISKIVEVNLIADVMKFTEYLTLNSGILTFFDENLSVSNLSVGDIVIVDYLEDNNSNFPATGNIAEISNGNIIIEINTGELSLEGEFTLTISKANVFNEFFYTPVLFDVIKQTGDSESVKVEGSDFFVNKVSYNELNCTMFLDLDSRNKLDKYYNSSQILIRFDGNTYRHSSNFIAILKIEDNGLINLYRADLLIKFGKNIM